QLRSTGGPAGPRAAFGPATTIATGDGNGQLALGAAGDGGGFAIYNHTGGINGEGQLFAGAFGTAAATGDPGIAGVPAGVTAGGAGTNGSCQQLGFGSFTIDAAGCILKGKGADAQNYVASTEINLWGLRIVPDAGVKIIINPKTFELNTTGGVRVIVSAPAPVGDVVLYHGVLKRDLRAVLPGTTLFEFPSGDFKADLLGFDISADIKVRLEKDGVHIPVDLRLPPAFGNFTGHAELVADRTTGLHVDSLHIHLGPIPLGALVIDSVDIDYRSAGDVWTGAGTMTVPAGGRLDIMARFAMGDFEQATFTFKPGTPIPIGPFVYLLDFGGGFAVKPAVSINANATLGVGAAVNGESPVKVHGDFTMTFPKAGPADFRLKGSVALFFLQVGDGSLDFQSDGYAAFRGHTGVSVGPLSVNADVDGFVDKPTGKYGASLAGTVALCVKVPAKVCVQAGADAAVSSLGFAACGHASVLGLGIVDVGLSYPWADWHPAYLVEPPLFLVSLVEHLGPCHVDRFRLPPPRARAAQAGGGTPVTVAGGLPTETILLKGAGGAPRVSVTGPAGQVLSSDGPSAAGYVMEADGVDAAYVVLRRPAAGTWTVTTLPGSPAIGALLTADGYTPASVTATLGGHGRARTVGYRIGHLGHDQRVSFVERGAFGTHVLGTTTRPAGTLRFRPADARGGPRTVTAVVEHDGIATDTTSVGTYVAPGPVVPGTVRGLRTRRTGTTLTVTWAPLAGAARYAVTLRGARGTRLGQLVAAPGRRARFAAVRRDERVTVQVRALSAALRSGPASTVLAGPGR
ncbi:MAG: domain containing protein, partial [Solirubrobacterales bacterium]|nr:domain containing protein [Solirubrobacterales bacterium]